MRAIIITGGTINDYTYYKTFIKPEDTIICADSGYDHAVKMGINIDILIGDLDSISSVPENVPIIRYPVDKDQTDTELALNYVKNKGFTEILLIGAIGTRLDHSIANIFLLTQFNNTIIIDETHKIMIGSNLYLHETEGTIVSLLPLTHCSGIYTENLKYPLINASMAVGYSRGISNVTTEEKATIKVKEGIMLVIIVRE